MEVVPITLRKANDFVEKYHRHSKRTARDGGKFAIGVSHEGVLVGVAIVGHPLARMLNDGFTAEVLRTCVSPEAPKNANSFLYGRCWRIWQQMGGKRLVTYTLTTESGASLRGAGWEIAHKTKPAYGGWGRKGRDREQAKIYTQLKFRWEARVK